MGEQLAAPRHELPTGRSGPRPRRANPSTWRLPIALLVLAVIPIVGGAIRIAELAGNVQVTVDNDHVVITTPIPIVVHIVSACLYSVLGAFQFSPGLRQRRRGWHRAAGRVLVPLGLVAAISAVWMTLWYPRPGGTGQLLFATRLLVGSAMAVALVLGVSTIRRRDVRQHRKWMIRAYAIGLGAGTQILTLGLGEPMLGDSAVTHDLLMAAGWVINLLVAEWAIHRWRPSPRWPWSQPTGELP